MTEYIDRTGEPDDVFEREVLARVEDPMTPVPFSPVALLDQLDAAREAAYDEVVRLCRGGDNRWTMSIPARPTVDSDLLIAKALDDHKRLAAAVRAVLALAEELDAWEANAHRYATTSGPDERMKARARAAAYNRASEGIRAATTAALSVTP